MITRVLAALLLFAAALLVATPTAADLPPVPVLYAVGDSITAGFGTQDHPERAWPQVLADRVFGEDHTHLHVVAHPGQCLWTPTGCGYPTPLFQTWQAEVLNAVPTPTTVVVESGTNDLGKADDATLEAVYGWLVSTGQAHGIRVIVGTIPPRASSWWTSYWTWGPQRDRLNAWIRTTFNADVADFDAALAGSDTWARPEIITSDGVHPNRYGHDDMAYCVPVGEVQ
jgi:lysophospholipase L1-like esterase